MNDGTPHSCTDSRADSRAEVDVSPVDGSGDEFDLIRRYFTRDRDLTDGLLLGPGDDAAIVESSGRIAISTDTLIEGVHFPATISANLIGHRALAVNLSDLAAMGARPRWCTLALTLPAADAQWLQGFADGFYALARLHGVRLVGGDITRGGLSITVQVIGDVAQRWPARSGAHPGDDVYVTGTLGDSAAGLTVVNEQAMHRGAAHAALADRFLRPQPRVTEGLALAELASAAIDVSDGLLADLGHICAASGCSAVVDVERLPLSAELLSVFPPMAAERFALAGGDDYELCFTASPARAAEIEAAFAKLGTPLRRIGEVLVGTGVVTRRDGEAFDSPARGYSHF